jgi:putative transposase
LEGRALSRPKSRDDTAVVPPNMEEIGRKHPIHCPVHDRRDTPIIVFLTVCTKRRKPILTNSEAHARLINAWRAAKMWQVGRYVIMPDHIHLFCAPSESETQPLLQWVRYWKSATARNWITRADTPIWQRHFWTRNCAGARVTIRNGNMWSRILFVRDWSRDRKIGHTRAR